MQQRALSSVLGIVSRWAVMGAPSVHTSNETRSNGRDTTPVLLQPELGGASMDTMVPVSGSRWATSQHDTCARASHMSAKLWLFMWWLRETVLVNRRSKKVIMESSNQHGRLVFQAGIEGTEVFLDLLVETL
ncbi:hypothetical protein EDD16DRAFT_1726432 [Pisolithus croceorrhizus]|nr:hypothetical protein EDD16DRAFT_1726432 [Pisolithus croceorrhizus]KAI6120387.1 hypothetical protein EV401DRAFT_1887671 [Pisolithus croceorrhizus]